MQSPLFKYRHHLGKIIWPEKTSATFASLVGNLDRRVELDRRIERGSKRYKAMLSIMASKLSYENTNFVSSVLHNHWKVLTFNNNLFSYFFLTSLSIKIILGCISISISNSSVNIQCISYFF